MLREQPFFRVATLDDVPPGTLRQVDVVGRAIVLANVGGRMFAVGSVCAHRGGPIGEGRIRGGCIVCPWHAWMYRPSDGSVAFPAGEKACLPVYPVRIDGQDILVSLQRVPSRELHPEPESKEALL